MFKGLEHPSAFPSMLRGSTPEPRPLIRKDSNGSSNQLRRVDSINNSATAPNHSQRKDSSVSSTPTRRDSGPTPLSRRDSTATVLSRKDSGDAKSNKRHSLADDFRRLSFGNSIYLRPDSTGAVNLIRRDSFGRKDVNATHHNPRDFVGKLFEYEANQSVPCNNVEQREKDLNSILRRSPSVKQGHEFGDSNLTTANLSKHVTILDKNDNTSDKLKVETFLSARRNSNGSLSNYLASRRISVDSLDVRHNSKRGSAASADVDMSSINNVNVDEVNCPYLLATFLFSRQNYHQNSVEGNY